MGNYNDLFKRIEALEAFMNELKEEQIRRDERERIRAEQKAFIKWLFSSVLVPLMVAVIGVLATTWAMK